MSDLQTSFFCGGGAMYAKLEKLACKENFRPSFYRLVEIRDWLIGFRIRVELGEEGIRHRSRWD